MFRYDTKYDHQKIHKDIKSIVGSSSGELSINRIHADLKAMGHQHSRTTTARRVRVLYWSRVLTATDRRKAGQLYSIRPERT